MTRFLRSFIGFEVMELPELSLAPTSCCKMTLECSSSESSDTSSSRKRKGLSDRFLENKLLQGHGNIDLQHNNERLPLDWEQCLDLESGKIYFLNRKTLKRSWDRPTPKYHHSQKLDLELNISSPYNSKQSAQVTRKEDDDDDVKKSKMMAMACMKCHLLVIVSKSSPTCPNCKYVHPIPPAQKISPPPPPRKAKPTFKPLDTLTLFS